MINMWFRSAKEFKENMESKMILITTARFTTHSFKKMERAINHNEREIFVDEWLIEPVYNKKYKLIPVVHQINPNEFN